MCVREREMGGLHNKVNKSGPRQSQAGCCLFPTDHWHETTEKFDSATFFYGRRDVTGDEGDDVTSIVVTSKFLSRILYLFNYVNLLYNAGNAKGGSITVPLTSCLTGLD